VQHASRPSKFLYSFCAGTDWASECFWQVWYESVCQYTGGAGLQPQAGLFASSLALVSMPLVVDASREKPWPPCLYLPMAAQHILGNSSKLATVLARIGQYI